MNRGFLITWHLAQSNFLHDAYTLVFDIFYEKYVAIYHYDIYIYTKLINQLKQLLYTNILNIN